MLLHPRIRVSYFYYTVAQIECQCEQDCLGIILARARISDVIYETRGIALNLFTRKKSDAAALASPSIPPSFLALPPLVTKFDTTQLYIVPRVRIRATGDITHLDNA